MAEINETIVSLEQVKDIYNIEVEFCAKLIQNYDVIARRVYKLAEAWTLFVSRRG